MTFCGVIQSLRCLFNGYMFTEADVENGRCPLSPLDLEITTGWGKEC
jgi:hypothetical protein